MLSSSAQICFINFEFIERERERERKKKTKHGNEYFCNNQIKIFKFFTKPLLFSYTSNSVR